MANKKGAKSKKGLKINRDRMIISISAVFIVITLFFVAAVYTVNDMKKRVYSGLEDVGDDVSYPISELDSSCFFTDSYGFKGYEDEKYTYKRGIDVSEYQSDIDWERVKAAGVEFAFIRLGYRTSETGRINKDTYFDENIKAAKENGIDIGVYFFSQATDVDEAIKEAEFVVDKLKNTALDLPVAFDFEEVKGAGDRTYWLTKDEVTECADAFCTIIENYGYESIIYLNPSQAAFKYSLSQIYERNIWLAHYTDKTTFKYKFDFWQYSKTGTVDGIEWPVDLDIMLIEK